MPTDPYDVLPGDARDPDDEAALQRIRDAVMAKAAETEQAQFKKAMHDEPMRVLPREPWTEQRITAVVARVGFLVCAVGTAVTVGLLLASWAGFLAGTVAFGTIVLAHLRNEQEARLNAQSIVDHRTGPRAGNRFDVVPPMGRG